MAEVRPKEAPGRAGVDVLAETVRANKSGVARGVVSICSANRFVLQAALERAARSGSPVLVESTSNQVNPEGGYTGIRPAAFAALVHSLAGEADLPLDRVILGGDHLGPYPWRERGSAVAMERAAEMVRA
jgi:D-tagatose-1,6-bisphosphate aldolase subunit GatZ/KbaZ